MIRKTIKFPKTDLRYWEQKVAFQTPASRTYSVQIQVARRRSWLSLGTANKAQAAIEARKLYVQLKANGWKETMQRRKPQQELAARKIGTTIREFVDAVRENTSLLPKTLEAYAQSLRKIASDIAGLGGSRNAWDVKLASLTSEKIGLWRTQFIRRAANPLKEKSARVSANSFILQARALFSKEALARVRDVVEIPEPVPFSGIKVERMRVARYRATFDFATLIESARSELAEREPEQFKIFLLAAMAGMRRNEIDKLPWSAFRFDEGLIRIEATEHFRAKSQSSEGDVLVDPELIEIFRGFHARRKGDFVIESDCEPARVGVATYEHYRCGHDIRALLAWLRSHGVVSRTPLHTLRKEYGSQINSRFGLTAAQEMLRHSNIHTTATHYVENKQRSVLGFGHLLTKDERTIIPMGEAQAF
jgi:integrase